MNITTDLMRICRWCGFFFEGPSKRLNACPNCEQRNDGRDQFSISAVNAKPEDLAIAIPHLLAAVQQLRHELARMGKELAAAKR